MNLISKSIIKILRYFGYDLTKYDKDKKEFSPDFTEKDINILKKVLPYTMTSYERIFSLINAVEYIQNYNITGSIVECGVWKGGSMMAVAETLKRKSDNSRNLYLFDTFEGMPEPKEIDLSIFGMNANKEYEKSKNISTGGSQLYYAALDEVKLNFSKVGYDKDKVHFIKGKVEETIPKFAPDNIALLRLDTDWYDSTKHELSHLFPRLAKGGVLIIDDYGHWEGARKAVDEYFKVNNIQILLNRIDYTGRIGVKF